MRSHGVACALVILFAVCDATTAAAQKPYSCPSCNLTGIDFTTKGYDLVGANLSNATLKGAIFNGLNLSNATLSGADLSNANFTGANLTGAELSTATLTNTNFTKATLARADFQFSKFNCTVIAGSDVSAATFGPALANPTPVSMSSCRTSFASTIMSCEFIRQWKDLDLTGANISKCFASLSGVDFTNAVMPGVVFSSGNPDAATSLTNTKWRGANLVGANFNAALLENADFSGTSTLPGAQLTNANLTYVSAKNSKFDYANLGNNPTTNPPQPGARLAFAYLAGVSFTNANLQSTDFSLANVTGVVPGVFARANLSGARFAGANLSGIDLSQARAALGVDMSNANLANVNLKNIDFSPSRFETCGGTVTEVPSSFVGAFLCGAVVDHTNLNCANLTGAYMPTEAIDVPGGDGQPVHCPAVTFTSPISNAVPASGIGCFTICPNGTPGSCDGRQWTAGGVPAQPCCTSTPTNHCPPHKKPGFPCTSDCDCGKKCSGNVCQ